MLEGLEKELKAVNKAREALGDRAPTFAHREPSHHNKDARGEFGRKRRHDDINRDDDLSSADDDVPDEVRRIPMPRDTPPPIPKRYLDEWYAKRRARKNANANTEPLRGGRNIGRHGESQASTSAKAPSSLPDQVPPVARPVEVKTVYEAKPVVRDLQKEAVAAFMPTVVRRKLDKSRGLGGLMEPEEADRLEREGYLKTSTIPAMDKTIGNGDTLDNNNHVNYSEQGHTHSARLSEPPSESRPRAYRTTVEDVDDEEA